MADLSVEYMGLKLKSPIIVSSGPMTRDVESMKKCEKAGAGAVVVKSIFEEQIAAEADAAVDGNEDYLTHAGADDYMANLAKDYYIERYCDLIRNAKKELSIPVIASINCSTLTAWLDYAERFVASGADAIELNYYPMVSSVNVKGKAVDEALLDFAKAARKRISVPLSIKMGRNYSALSFVLKQIDDIGFDAVVLFNRAFRQDIDLNTLKFKPARITSGEDEYPQSLRWTALMSGDLKCDIAANTGIHSGETAVKMLLAGASAVEVCSVLIKNGVEAIDTMNKDILSFMEKNGYENIADFKGKLSQENLSNGDAWERVQYLKTV